MSTSSGFSKQNTSGLAVVTGGSSGVGKAAVEAFIDAGMDVIFTYFTREEEARDLSERLSSGGTYCVPVQVDIGNESQVLEFASKVNSYDRPVAVLANCAGQVFRGPMKETTPTAFRHQLEINVVAPFILTRELVSLLEGGSVVNVASISSVTGMTDRSAYVSSKAAISGLTVALATELASHVRVNAILAGILATPMNDQLLADASMLSQVAARIPLGRLGEGSDIASVIRFLGSDEARYVTGALWEVDGGVLARTSLPAGDPQTRL